MLGIKSAWDWSLSLGPTDVNFCSLYCWNTILWRSLATFRCLWRIALSPYQFFSHIWELFRKMLRKFGLWQNWTNNWANNSRVDKQFTVGPEHSLAIVTNAVTCRYPIKIVNVWLILQNSDYKKEEENQQKEKTSHQHVR